MCQHPSHTRCRERTRGADIREIKEIKEFKEGAERCFLKFTKFPNELRWVLVGWVLIGSDEF